MVLLTTLCVGHAIPSGPELQNHPFTSHHPAPSRVHRLDLFDASLIISRLDRQTVPFMAEEIGVRLEPEVPGDWLGVRRSIDQMVESCYGI